MTRPARAVAYPLKLALAAVVVFGTVSAPAFAVGPGGFLRGLGNERSFLDEGPRTIAPFAHVVFCVNDPQECEDHPGSRIIQLSPEVSEQIRAINLAVNREIAPQADEPGHEVWHVEALAGACHDYAVTKRERLIKAGFSPHAVRLAVVRVPDGEGHLVVVIRTSRGDMVLDNRTDRIKLWSKTDLQWIEIESSDNPKLWNAV